jgi:serine/threonine-protein kinase
MADNREIARAATPIYRALQISLNREVAVKMVPPGRHGETETIERMLREARAAASLSHNNIVSIASFQR